MGNVNTNTTNNINNSITNTISSVIQQETTNIIQTQVIDVKCNSSVSRAATDAVENCIERGIDRGLSPDDIIKLCNFNPCTVKGITQIQFIDIKLIVDMSTDLKTETEQKVTDTITNTIKDHGGFNILGLNESDVSNITNSVMTVINSIKQTDIDNIEQAQRIAGKNVSFVNVTQKQSGKFILDKLLKSDSYVKAVQDVSTKISQQIETKRNKALIAILGTIVLIIVIFVGYEMFERKKSTGESSSSLSSSPPSSNGSSSRSSEE